MLKNKLDFGTSWIIILGVIGIVSLLILAGCENSFDSCMGYCVDQYEGCGYSAWDSTLRCHTLNYADLSDKAKIVQTECFDRCSGTSYYSEIKNG